MSRRDAQLTNIMTKKTNNGDPNGTIVEQLTASISFAALVRSDGVKLSKKGDRLAGCCPFHDDSTPSLFVAKDDSRGKCYGCDWWGSIFDYVMKKQSCDFLEALDFLDDLSDKVAG